MPRELQMLTKNHDNASYKVIDIRNESELASLVAEADVVIRQVEEHCCMELQ